jgi:tyrosine-protein kinase Etk/Wzc
VELQNASAHAELEQTDGRQATGNAGTQEINEALRSALRNPTSLLRTLMSQVVIKETDAARENQMYTDEHPAGSRTLKQLEGLKDRLREELKRLGADPALTADDALLMAQEEEQKAGVSENVSAQLQAERVSLAVRTKMYEDQLARLEAEIAQAAKETQKLPDELQQYMTLAREKRVNEELYTMLCERLAGAQVDEQSELCDIRVFDLARLPLKPLKPKPALLTVLGTFMGLLLGICVAFSIEYLDDSLRTTQEVQSYLGLPVLAEIPKVRVRNKLVSAKKTPELVGPM